VIPPRAPRPWSPTEGEFCLAPPEGLSAALEPLTGPAVTVLQAKLCLSRPVIGVVAPLLQRQVAGSRNADMWVDTSQTSSGDPGFGRRFFLRGLFLPCAPRPTSTIFVRRPALRVGGQQPVPPFQVPAVDSRIKRRPCPCKDQFAGPVVQPSDPERGDKTGSRNGCQVGSALQFEQIFLAIAGVGRVSAPSRSPPPGGRRRAGGLGGVPRECGWPLRDFWACGARAPGASRRAHAMAVPPVITPPAARVHPQTLNFNNNTACNRRRWVVCAIQLHVVTDHPFDRL